jgi:hypothetical protein
VLLLNECLLLLFISLSTQSGNFWIYPRILLILRIDGKARNRLVTKLYLIYVKQEFGGSLMKVFKLRFLKVYYLLNTFALELLILRN